MADVKWIKITTDIFDDEKILMIESLPSADSIIVIWFKLLTFAGKQNNDGVFIMNNRIAYTDEMFASIFRRDVNVVRFALDTFQRFGMIDIVDDVITIPNWNKHQTLDSYEKKKERDRLYMAERRAKQRHLIGLDHHLADKSSNMSSDSSLTHDDKSSVVVISEEDKEGDKDLEGEGEVIQETVSYQQVVDMYHSICISFPKVKALPDKRKKAINARLKTYSIDDIRQAFEMAEESKFLKGANSRNWHANFDWIMSDSNMAKIIEGNYMNDVPSAPKDTRESYIDKWRNA